jgi:uncharacterized membrane protein
MRTSIFSMSAFLFLLQGCGIYETKGASPTAESSALTADPNNQITYAQVNQLIISQSCLTCHSASSDSGGLALTSYANVSAIIDEIKGDIDSGDMPQNGSLSASQIALFDQWYAQGHLEFGGVVASPTPSPIPSATPVLSSTVTFTQVNQTVFSTSCLKCHSSTKSSGGVILDTYADVSKSLSEVTADINSGHMPADGSLTSAQKTLFDAWIAQGAPEL